jgi:peptidoglycan/LPS O-acetylase OafA/YrhL
LKYQPSLDGLRALAVVGVIFAHCRLIVGGGHGVDVFFVLSGFLITSILMRGPPLGDFYVRRARRLLPALIVFLIAYVLTAPLLFPADDAGREALLALFYSNNWSMALDFRESGLAHTWSLSVVEQFYLLWPLALPRVIRSSVPLYWLGAIWLFLTVLRVAVPDVHFTYYALHMTGLIVGAMLALKLPPARFGWPAFGAILFVFLFGEGWRGAWAIPLTEIATAILIPALLQSSRLTSAFAWKPVAWIGLISYGIYLWHWPIAYLTREHWWSLPVTLGLSLTLAAMSYYLLEQGFRVSRPAMFPRGRPNPPASAP